MRRQDWIVRFVALITAGSGLASLSSLIGRPFPHLHALRYLFPIEFAHLSDFLTLLIGFFLVIGSINIARRKRRAFTAVMLLASVAAALHFAKRDYEPGVWALILIGALLATRNRFTVRSALPDLRGALMRLIIGFSLAVTYGVAGFWLLDRREFGINFHIVGSFRRTLELMTLHWDTDLVPHSQYARWFLDSLSLMTVVAVGYSVVVLFRPVLYRYTTQNREREQARSLLMRHGRAALDLYKIWPDKSFFFSRSRRAFLSYKVAANFALVLGDPVGPEEELPELISDFLNWCRDNDWRTCFYQALPDFLPLYARFGLKKLKIGDDAIVNLELFNLEGGSMKKLRGLSHRLEKEGIHTVYHPVPIPDEVLEQAREVSDEWLSIPGRQERTFTLGQFETSYVRSTPLLAAYDAAGRMLAFVNVVPSYAAGQATLDLMRRRTELPNGVMEYLFVKLLLMGKEQGYKTFDLGMAPMSGFQESESATFEERLVHVFFSHLNFLFSFSGLRQFKSKFATGWEPRYAVFQRFVDLPRLALAIQRASRVPRRKQRHHGTVPRPAAVIDVRTGPVHARSDHNETATVH